MSDKKINIEKVLEVSEKEFSRHGFKEASMRKIARESETSTTALYYHFHSKEELYQECCDWSYELFLEKAERRIDALNPTTRNPGDLAGIMFDVWMENPATLLLTCRDVVESLVDPKRSVTAAHYSRTLDLFLRFYKPTRNNPIQHGSALAFASMVFGFCALLNIELRNSLDINTPSSKIREEKSKLSRDLLCSHARNFYTPR